MPLIVTTALVRTLLGIRFREFNSPEIRRVDRSENILIPSRDYLEQQWQPWWNNYRDEQLGKNNGYFCELYAGFACLQFHRVAFNYCNAHRVDAAGGMFHTSIDILKPPFMGIKELSHWTCIQAFHEDGSSDIQFALWEPQNSDGELVPLEDVLYAESVIIKTIEL